MGELQTPGVQGLSRKAPAGGLSRRVAQVAPLPSGVERVTHDGVADVGHVDPYLMSAAGDRMATDQRDAADLLIHVIEGSCRAALCNHSHPLALTRMAVDRRIHDPICFPRYAKADGEIGLVDLSVSECDGETEVGPIRLGHYQQAGGVLVEPVDDPGPFDTPDAGEVAAVVEEGIDEGARWIAGCGMDHETGRFVYQQDVPVLEHDVEGYVLRLRIELLRRRFVDCDPIAVMDGCGWFGGFFVEPDVTGVNQPAYPGPGPFGAELGEALVEACSVEVLRDREVVAGGHAAARRPARTWRPIPMTIIPSEIS